jgi:hypothetical protein
MYRDWFSRHFHRFRPASAVLAIEGLPRFDAEVDSGDHTGRIPSGIQCVLELLVQARLLHKTITLLVGCHFDAE